MTNSIVIIGDSHVICSKNCYNAHHYIHVFPTLYLLVSRALELQTGRPRIDLKTLQKHTHVVIMCEGNDACGHPHKDIPAK